MVTGVLVLLEPQRRLHSCMHGLGTEAQHVREQHSSDAAHQQERCLRSKLSFFSLFTLETMKTIQSVVLNLSFCVSFFLSYYFHLSSDGQRASAAFLHNVEKVVKYFKKKSFCSVAGSEVLR